LPGLTTAMRLDVHFWWNMLEMSMLLVAAHFFLKHSVFYPKKESQAESEIQTNTAPNPVQ
jgi:hypothetical protein